MKINLVKDFKEFAVRGNMIDIAIGVIIGTAFNKVVDVLVKEIFLPPLSFLTDGINWENKRVILRHAATEPGITRPEEIAIGYGKLIEAGVDFLIISITVFAIVKLLHGLRQRAEDPKNKTVQTPKDIELLDHIADLMERQLALMERQNGGSDEVPLSGK